jgi:predicted enzyme related to lactoylglutathione lyase
MPGVPCWIDTAQPDPEAAVAFYGGLFGWAFEDRMPIDAPGRYFVAQLHDRDVAAVGSQPEGHAAPPAWSTYVWVESADAAAAKAQDAGGKILARRSTWSTPGAWPRSPTRGRHVLRLGGEGEQGRPARQRARHDR